MQFNFNNNELRIGCQIHKFEVWLNSQGEAIANKYHYSSEEQIKLKDLIQNILRIYQ